MRDRLPQRFQWKDTHDSNWRNGVVMPCEDPADELWSIRAGHGFGSFQDEPWEVMGHIIGDAAAFRWIDNDYQWHPIGGVCCDTVYQSSDDLLTHIRMAH